MFRCHCFYKWPQINFPVFSSLSRLVYFSKSQTNTDSNKWITSTGSINTWHKVFKGHPHIAPLHLFFSHKPALRYRQRLIVPVAALKASFLMPVTSLSPNVFVASLPLSQHPFLPVTSLPVAWRGGGAHNGNEAQAWHLSSSHHIRTNIYIWFLCWSVMSNEGPKITVNDILLFRKEIRWHVPWIYQSELVTEKCLIFGKVLQFNNIYRTLNRLNNVWTKTTN